MSVVSKAALSFVEPAILSNGELVHDFSWHEYTKGFDSLLFFYPLDFTFVCPSELLAINNRLPLFNERNIKVAAISVDSVYSHAAWRRASFEDGGIGDIGFPLISDLARKVCRYYNVENEEASISLRSAVLIDKLGVVRAQITCDLAIGRDIDEILRLFDAIQHVREHGELCPVGWRSGQESIKANVTVLREYLLRNSNML